MKQLVWIGSSRRDLGAMPLPIQEDIAFALTELQFGRDPGRPLKDFKPMNQVGSGVFEIRVSDSRVQARCFYVAKFKNAIVVLHCFIKKTQKTSKADMNLAMTRFKFAERNLGE